MVVPPEGSGRQHLKVVLILQNKVTGNDKPIHRFDRVFKKQSEREGWHQVMPALSPTLERLETSLAEYTPVYQPRRTKGRQSFRMLLGLISELVSPIP